MKEKPTLTNSRPYFVEKKTKQNQILKILGEPHVESFNYMLTEGIKDCVANIGPVNFELTNGDRIQLVIEECSIAPPTVPLGAINAKDRRIFPTECRQRGSTYKGMCNVRVGWKVNGLKQPSVDRDLGEVPIMMKSSACHLNGLKPFELIDRGEHEQEWGGQFIVKGHEKLIRMLLMSRRNYPIAIKRSTWKNRGNRYSDIGVMVRCVKTDQTSTNNVLHFIYNGTAKMMFSYNKFLSYLPVVLVLKCLANFTDEYIYRELSRGYEDDQYYLSCIQNMIREVHDEDIHTHEQCINFLGQVFRQRFFDLPSWYTNADIANFLLDNTILIHLDDNIDKFSLIIHMVQKLFQAAQGKCLLEGADGIMMMELLLGGHLYQKVLKEKLEGFLNFLKINIRKKADSAASFSQNDFLLATKYAGGIERTFENFLATGNLTSRSGLGLMQNSGLVIMAENINRMRYMSHFRAVHRGSYFLQMRTTEARQLLPDAWGFICPVHTPDGGPCGLLNHLTVHCKVSKSPDKQKVANIPKVLCELGMIPLNNLFPPEKESYIVLLEGRVIGHVAESEASQIVNKMRLLKIDGQQIPVDCELALVPRTQGGQFPGLYIFVGAARMMRPVMNLTAKRIELIGTFEQVYMDICVTLDEAYDGVTTHAELSETAFMSNLANLIPMPDCNQSPRNMYQCQMGKQTMGTPLHYWQLQAETKLYRLQTPATPLFRPVHHDNIDLDDFAMGTNAIVAVISYTGYDMEDAMIINKAAYERGFAHGQVYHSEFVELKGDSYFSRDPHNQALAIGLDTDGLPHPGMILTNGSPYYCYFDINEARYVIHRYKSAEACVIDNIKLLGAFTIGAPKKACITYRVSRNPSVGDKFASRAGQKGICSQKWPAQDLPFTDSGIIPDILFNPHGFPSRMTIAMMIETMSGKAGAINGKVHDATPFKFGEGNTAVDYFGKQLEQCGYNYYGTERMYSGTDGREMKADIFFGVVHYQRLRHMVSDKWQVRSTGPIDPVTHQPLKGRKRGGGVRFGEMERDALISHGASFLLQDRLFHCSDRVSTIICRSCGTLLGPVEQVKKRLDKTVFSTTPATCRLCGDGNGIEYIEIPYIFKFLVTQLSSMNINVRLSFKTV